MFGYFHNSSIRRYTVLLGDLFSKIYITRVRGGKLEYQRVPITNSSKEKFMVDLKNKINKINSENNIAKVETILPRMNMNLVDIMYDPTKKTSIHNRTSNEYKQPSLYNPVPYKFIFELGIYARYRSDMYQIVEQILPYFQPHFTTQITELHGNDITIDRDINIAIQSVMPDESVDGAVGDRRHIEWTLMFEMTGYIYPPSIEITNQIRTIYLDFFGNSKEMADENVFESVDFQVNPVDVDEEDWDGSYNSSMTENIPIPKEPKPPEVR